MSTQRGYIQLHIKHLSELQMFFQFAVKHLNVRRTEQFFLLPQRNVLDAFLVMVSVRWQEEESCSCIHCIIILVVLKGLKKPGFGSF